jgi:heme exporter protein B
MRHGWLGAFWAATLAVLRKDVRVELRSRELISTMGLFALLAVLIFSFALELDRQARLESVSGVLWVTVTFAALLGLNRSTAQERDSGNLDALLLAPVPRGALYAGKVIGTFVFTLFVGLVIAFISTVIYNVDVLRPGIVLALLFGSLGLSSVGTLLAAMTAQTRARESLLPIVMLPIALPMLLAAVRATTGMLVNTPVEEWASWLNILAVLVVVFTSLGLLFFDAIVEE